MLPRKQSHLKIKWFTKKLSFENDISDVEASEKAKPTDIYIRETYLSYKSQSKNVEYRKTYFSYHLIQLLSKTNPNTEQFQL